MQRLASDMDNPEFVGAANPDALLHVRFYTRTVHQPFESEKQGRPIFKEVVFVKIHTPGNQLNVIDVPADDSHKTRFRQQWDAFSRGKMGDEQITGTPLAQWPQITASQAEELRALKFFTVEQIAGASDERINQIGMCAGMSPYAFRDKAKRFLDFAKGVAEVNSQSEELKKRDAEIAELRAQMQELMANQKRGPGRPPKVIEE